MNPPPGEPAEAGAAGATEHDVEAEVVRWLAERDASCPICSYNLCNAPTSACPECGAELSLSITSPNLQHGAWTLGIASFAMALGFDVVVLVLMIVATVVSGFMPPPHVMTIMITLAFLAVLSGAGLLSLVHDRRTFQRRPLKNQWRIAIGIFIGVFVLHAFGGFVMFALATGLA